MKNTIDTDTLEKLILEGKAKVTQPFKNAFIITTEEKKTLTYVGNYGTNFYLITQDKE